MGLARFIATAAVLVDLFPTAASLSRACNPAGIQPGPFRLAAFDPVTNKTTGITVTLASRAVPILAPTTDGSLDGALNFTFDAEAGRLKPAGYEYSDDARVGDTLTFGAFDRQNGPNGGLAQKAVDKCFEGNGTPMFLVVGGADVSDDLALTGWNVCGSSGFIWNGGNAPLGNCTGAGLQILMLDDA
ncbi:hypothetical protein F5Y05DRAFT_424971 [Hypoxylon sp. FL0543]|nr:hypothetical protein F5Y05DRAFT_424971 [Hypoxylon sp. FL0543]